MAEAFRFYRDELNWQVYPVDGPWSDKPDPGKSLPSRHGGTTTPRSATLRSSSSRSVATTSAFARRASFIIVDLDSKTDEGRAFTIHRQQADTR